MYKSLRQSCERLLRIPPDPEPPPGHHSSIQIFQAAPNFYRYLLFTWALGTVLGFIFLCWFLVAPIVGGVVLLKHHHRWGVILFFFAGAVVLFFVLFRLFRLAVLKLEFDKRWYIVTDRSLRVREGVWGVREMTVTFANIQNIAISQGPVQRALGIADLRVETAGGGSVKQNQVGQSLHTALFRGIQNANAVRELIQERLRHLKDSGLGDEEEASGRRRAIQGPSFLEALREVQKEAVALRIGLENQPI
jgi:membrane protein YdbS with pleckstrin-like domain